MDILKDLPSYDRENFSKFSQGSFRVRGLVCLVLTNLVYVCL